MYLVFPCLVIFFFFYRSGYHRDLHSFPTRRSSDLRPRPPAGSRRRYGRQGKASTSSTRRASPDRSTPRGRTTSCTTADRKSTRLNSSHPSISYAVFCLKKKKKQKSSCSCS